MHMQVYLHVHVHMRMCMRVRVRVRVHVRVGTCMRVRVRVRVHVRVGTCIHVRVRVHTSTETLPPLPGASEASKPLLAPSKLESVISACDERVVHTGAYGCKGAYGRGRVLVTRELQRGSAKSAEGRKGVIQTHLGRIGARRSA